MKSIEYLWKDRRRRLGLPLSFTRYSLSEDRLFCETGLLNLKADEVLLYRVQDLELTMTLGQRIFGVGTVCVHSSDRSVPPRTSGGCGPRSSWERARSRRGSVMWRIRRMKGWTERQRTKGARRWRVLRSF